MEYNKPLIAALMGSLSTIPYELITRLFLAWGIGKYSAYQLTSLVITLNRPTPALGFVVSCVIGGVFSFIFYYTLPRVGSDYLLIKSLVFALLIWVAMEAIFVWLIEGPKLILPRPVMDYYIHLAGSVGFGLTQGLLYKRYLVTPTA